MTTDPTLRDDPDYQALSQHYLPRLEKGWLMMDEATLHRQFATADRYLTRVRESLERGPFVLS